MLVTSVCSEGRSWSRSCRWYWSVVGDLKQASSGEKFCRVEAGDVAGWAMHSGSEAVSDPDNDYGYRNEHFCNFAAVKEEDTVADAPAKLLTTPVELEQ